MGVDTLPLDLVSKIIAGNPRGRHVLERVRQMLLCRIVALV
jgi:hypothetical protein